MSGNIIWDSVQSYQIHKLSKTAEAVKEVVAQDMGAALATVKQFEDRINKLVLVCNAQFELLQSVTNITEQQLAEKINEIDLRDGNADGKITPTQKKCPDCGAGICAKFNRCLFCGYKDETGDLFTTL